MQGTMEQLMNLTLNTLETYDYLDAPAITVVCGAGAGVELGMPTFNGSGGLLSSKEAAERVIKGTYDSAYVRFRERDNELICGRVNPDGTRAEILFKHILSNDCLNRLPAFFYSFIGCYFSEEKLAEVHKVARNKIDTHIDFLEFLQAYCEVKEKDCNIFTLNIDGVLDVAGIKATKIHGQMGRNRCVGCGSNAVGLYPYIPRSLYSGTTEEYLDRYKCHHCGAQIRPDIVLMDEDEPQLVIADLVSSLQRSTCIVSIGVNHNNHIGRLLLSEAKAGDRCLIRVDEDGVTVQK